MIIAFRLKPGRDDDLINWYESLGDGDRSYYIRETLRKNLNSHMGGSNHALPPSPSPEIDSGKKEDMPKRSGGREFDIKKNDVSVDDLEKALESWM